MHKIFVLMYVLILVMIERYDIRFLSSFFSYWCACLICSLHMIYYDYIAFLSAPPPPYTIIPTPFYKLNKILSPLPFYFITLFIVSPLYILKPQQQIWLQPIKPSLSLSCWEVRHIIFNFQWLAKPILNHFYIIVMPL